MSKVKNELKDDPLMPLRHSAEHVLHSAMQELYPDLKKVMGPPIEVDPVNQAGIACGSIAQTYAGYAVQLKVDFDQTDKDNVQNACRDAVISSIGDSWPSGDEIGSVASNVYNEVDSAGYFGEDMEGYLVDSFIKFISEAIDID